MTAVSLKGIREMFDRGISKRKSDGRNTLAGISKKAAGCGHSCLCFLLQKGLVVVELSQTLGLALSQPQPLCESLQSDVAVIIQKGFLDDEVGQIIERCGGR